MKKNRTRKKKRASSEDLLVLVSELKTYTEEFDLTDPAGTEVLLDTHISSLMQKGIVAGRRGRKYSSLSEVVKAMLGKSATDDLLGRVEMFEQLISSYGGEPSTEDMEEALEVINEVITDIDRLVEKRSRAQQPLFE
jgi:hypothetical protein